MSASLYSWLQGKRHPILLAFLVLLAFWPLSTFLYIPKWDNIDCYLPYRHFVSYSLLQGEWPLWNPFQQFGYPAYSDLQNGMYNPFVLLLQCIGPYNTTSLTIELMFYLLVGALGAYTCARLVVETKTARFLMGLTYGLSGFMLGTTQIMIFIAGAAFLPLIVYHFVQWLRTQQTQYGLLLVFFLVLHLTSASPAYSIVLIYVLAFLFFIFFLRCLRQGTKWNEWLDWKKAILYVLLLLTIALPLFVSVYEFLPYFGRADKLPYSNFLLQNPFDYRSYISFVFPFVTLSDSTWFEGTDLTMRSAYFGLFPLVFMTITLHRLKEKNIQLLWLGFLVFLVLCAGGSTPLYRWIYSFPGFGLFRHPSLFRAHLLLVASALAAIGFDRWRKGEHRVLFKRIVLVLFTVIIGTLAIGFYVSHPQEWLSVVRQITQIKQSDTFSVRTWMVLNALVALVLVGICLFVLRKPNASARWVVALILCDLLIYSHVTGPYTVYFPYKNREYVHFFKQLPQIINQADAQRPYRLLVENYVPKKEGIWRNTATLFKRLTFDGHNQTQFKQFNVLERNGKMEWAKENSLFYVANKQAGTYIQPNVLWESEKSSDLTSVWSYRCSLYNPHIGLNNFSVRFKNNDRRPALVVLNQNYHALWKATWNGKPVAIRRVNDAFMGVTIPGSGKGKLEYSFDSPALRLSVGISILGYLAWVFWYFFDRKRAVLHTKRNTEK